MATSKFVLRKKKSFRLPLESWGNMVPTFMSPFLPTNPLCVAALPWPLCLVPRCTVFTDKCSPAELLLLCPPCSVHAIEILPIPSRSKSGISPLPQMLLSLSDHPRRQKSLPSLNSYSTYFSIHLATKGNLSGDVLLLCWNCYSNSALPFASSYASILTLPLDCKVLFLESCSSFFEFPPKCPSFFSCSFCFIWFQKKKNRIALGILWNVYHSSFDKAKEIQVDLTLQTCQFSSVNILGTYVPSLSTKQWGCRKGAGVVPCLKQPTSGKWLLVESCIRVKGMQGNTENAWKSEGKLPVMGFRFTVLILTRPSL